MNYNIAEIFYSIQGEGFYTGRVAIFIRFIGCNLDCYFCDEPLHRGKGTMYSLEDILNEVRQYAPCKFVILTGGEPSIQNHLLELVESLHKEGYYVAMETNGTREVLCSVDWITVSPKTDFFLRHGDELKIVYQGQDLSRYEQEDFKHFYIQPLNNKDTLNFDSIKDCMDTIMKNPKWHLSIQMHKVLKVN